MGAIGNGVKHLFLFINGQKQTTPYSRGMLEVLVKDAQDNLLSIIRENASVANKDIQDSSALLLALKRANTMGADHITLYLDNAYIFGQFKEDPPCSDQFLSEFVQEAKELMEGFESVTFKMM